MVQIHTVYEGSAWRMRVDGLQQECPTRSRSAVEHEARRVAALLGGRLYVHDVDGSIVGATDFRAGAARVRPTPEQFLG